MRGFKQKRKSFRDEMKYLKSENKLKEEKQPFDDLLKKVISVSRKPSGR